MTCRLTSDWVAPRGSAGGILIGEPGVSGRIGPPSPDSEPLSGTSAVPAVAILDPGSARSDGDGSQLAARCLDPAGVGRLTSGNVRGVRARNHADGDTTVAQTVGG